MSSLANFEDDDFDPTAAISLPARSRPARPEPVSPPAKAARKRTSSPRSKPAKSVPAAAAAPEPVPPPATVAPMSGGGPKVISARVPQELYTELATHVASLELTEGRPAYSQVVAVACEDHAQAVVETAVQAALAARRDWRAPRGARKAANATMLTLRFWPIELAALEQAQQAVLDSAALDEELRAKITRTSVIIAALQVALTSGKKQRKT